MIPISVLVAGKGTTSVRLKGSYSLDKPPRFGEIYRPVIAWNITNSCNLKCLHCYLNSGEPLSNELSEDEALNTIDQIAEVGSPMIIFTGGEPLLRRDLFKLALKAVDRGIKIVLSTNGTLISKKIARMIRDVSFMYVGVSIDSLDPVWHDYFRGVKGSFKMALKGLEHLIELGVDTGIRYTVTRYNIDDAHKLIDLALSIGAKRVTYYHLSYVGRARTLSRDWIPTAPQYFRFMDRLIELAKIYSGKIEIETTMAPFDGIYIALKQARDREELAKYLKFVRRAGGCGRKIVSIYPDGSVHPCQFVDFLELGNVRKERLSRIIARLSQPPYNMFIEPWKYVKHGKCSKCPYLQYCGGGDRVRAYYLEGGFDRSDPYCPIPIKTEEKHQYLY